LENLAPVLLDEANRRFFLVFLESQIINPLAMQIEPRLMLFGNVTKASHFLEQISERLGRQEHGNCKAHPDEKGIESWKKLNYPEFPDSWLQGPSDEKVTESWNQPIGISD
jgi:hypothetical protein